MTGQVIETLEYELKEESGSFWFRSSNTDDEWTGPYPSQEAVESAITRALEAVVAEITKNALGLK